MNSELAQRPVGTLSGFELTWFYYGHSRKHSFDSWTYADHWRDAVSFQEDYVACRSRYASGDSANIVLINVFIMVDDWGPYLMSVVISSAMLAILWHQRAEILGLFWLGQKAEPVGLKAGACLDSGGDFFCSCGSGGFGGDFAAVCGKQ